MRIFLIAALAALSLSSSAFAQSPLLGRDGEITPYPICSHLINRSTVQINGMLETYPQKVKGEMVHDTSNFKLEPSESREFCASGPFYEGQRVILTIKTLIPLFSCKTQIARDIYLDMDENEDGTKTYSATCR